MLLSVRLLFFLMFKRNNIFFLMRLATSEKNVL